MLDKTFAFFQAAESEEGFWTQPTWALMIQAQEEVKLLRSFPEIVMLIGSSRFKQSFEECSERLALEGAIVLGKHVFKPGKEWPLDDKRLVDRLHATQFRMIDLANRVHVLNIDGYIGKDTYNLIRYAMRVECPITFVEDKVRTLADEQVTLTTHHFLQGTRRRVDFEEAAAG